MKGLFFIGDVIVKLFKIYKKKILFNIEIKNVCLKRFKV